MRPTTPSLSLLIFLAAVAAYLLVPPGALLTWSVAVPLFALAATAVAWR